MQGWIKLHRELLEKPIWLCSTIEQRLILITLLMMASHKETTWEWQGTQFNIHPGQFITSLKSIAAKAGSGISIQNVRTALDKFEKYEFLTNKSTNKNRLVTIVNWELYQSNESELTSNLTGNQQAANKQLTTIKNDKNEKKDNTYPDSFETFYQEYPRPENKKSTFNNWKKAVKAHTIENILDSARNYKIKVTKDRTDKQYMKSSVNFLGRDEIYIDYLPENFKSNVLGIKQMIKPGEIKNDLSRWD